MAFYFFKLKIMEVSILIIAVFNHVACFVRDIKIKMAILGGRDGFPDSFQ